MCTLYREHACTHAHARFAMPTTAGAIARGVSSRVRARKCQTSQRVGCTHATYTAKGKVGSVRAACLFVTPALRERAGGMMGIGGGRMDFLGLRGLIAAGRGSVRGVKIDLFR